MQPYPGGTGHRPVPAGYQPAALLTVWNART